MKMCCARIPQAKGISSPANSSTCQKPRSSGSSSWCGTRYFSAIVPPFRRVRIRCSDDRGHDRGDDRHAGADADADAHGNSDLAEREAPGGKADEAARKAENGDDLAARAFEEISEFGEGRVEGGVSAGISSTGTGERHESGQDRTSTRLNSS